MAVAGGDAGGGLGAMRRRQQPRVEITSTLSTGPWPSNRTIFIFSLQREQR
jgi:hypothetical protein